MCPLRQVLIYADCAGVGVCVLSASHSAPWTEDISNSISQLILKEVIAFSVAFFFFFPPELYIKILFIP